MTRKLKNQPATAARSASGPSRRRALGIGAVAVLGAGGIGVWAFLDEPKDPPSPKKSLNEYPHDAQAYTQGLIFHDGHLYEGTGQEGQSSVRKVELTTGRVLQKADLDKELFGEGIALWKDRIYQLTWKAGTAYTYDLKTLKRLPRQFKYRGDGWGLTHDGTHLIMSDGTYRLRFLDPDTFKVAYVRDVRDDQGSVIRQLNELEYVKGEIYANVYGEDWIARISPKTGRLLGKIDLQGLLPFEHRKNLRTGEVLNGIAYDPKADRLFVTGKNWPLLFEIPTPGAS